MVRKVLSQRKHGDARLEAPRNSLDLLGQTCLRAVGDYLPVNSYELKHGCPKISTEEVSSMKRKSINNQTTHNQVRTSTPSVVARLMGMDMDMFPTTVNHQRKQVVQNNFLHNIRIEEDNSQHFVNHSEGDHRREHPQEEELQKFKKEFESWQQAARFKRTIPEQLLPQEILNNEFLYSDSIRSRSRSSMITNEKPIVALEEDHAITSRMYFDNRIGNSSSGPRKIVILRPGSMDRCGDSEEESWVDGSSNNNNNSIEEFLEGVKERLMSEFQGKCCLNKLKTSESPVDAMKKQIAKSFDDSLHTMHHHREPSLIRSSSAPAPVSGGTSFGKLLLEDRHILTGARIQRKHEAVEKKKKKKKEKLKTVSNFQHSCTLGGQLFERRFQSADDKYSCRNDIMSGPTVVMNYGNIQEKENATEVPPSPASTLSDSSPIRESSLPQEFREINSNLNELRRQLNDLESDSRKDTESEEDEHPEAEMMEEEDPVEKTYIRELLITSGLYYHYSSTTTTLSRGGGEKPINNHVFKKLEKSYMQMSKNCKESKMNRRLLFDLTNEAIIAGESMTVPTESGSKLLNSVWERIRTYLYPVEAMAGGEMRSTAWTMPVKDEEVDCVGKMVETWITTRLIEEVVKDLQHLHLERRWRWYNR